MSAIYSFFIYTNIQTEYTLNKIVSPCGLYYLETGMEFTDKTDTWNACWGIHKININKETNDP